MNNQLYNEDLNNNEYDHNQIDSYNVNEYEDNNIYGDDDAQEIDYQNENLYEPNSLKDINLLNIKMKIDLLNQKVNQMKTTFEKFDAISLNKEKNALRKKIDSYGDYLSNVNSFDYDYYFLNNSPTPSMNNYVNQYYSGTSDNDCNINNKKKLSLCFGSFDNYFLNKYNYSLDNNGEDKYYNNNENQPNYNNNGVYENETNKEEYQIEKTDNSNFVNINNNETKKIEFKIQKIDENIYNDNCNTDNNYKEIKNINDINTNDKINIKNNLNKNDDENNYSKNNNINKNDKVQIDSVPQEKIINENFKNKKDVTNLENNNNEKPFEIETKEKIESKGNSKNNNNKKNINSTQTQKQKKTLVFCENENITIKYDDREKITEISIYNSSGKKLNFIPKNINVYLNKLKKTRLKSILLNSNINNVPNNESYTKPKTNKNKKKNRSKTQEQTNKRKEQMNKVKKQTGKAKILNKMIPKTSNKNENIYQKLKEHIFFAKKTTSPSKKIEEPKKKEKIVICERFKNNPQMFFKEELCDLMIESLNLDKDEILTKSLSQKDIATNNQTNKTKKNKKSKDDNGLNMKAFNNLKAYFEENQSSDNEKEK